jgi:hypothetical protein
MPKMRLRYGELIALDGYKGDGICRIIRIEKTTRRTLTGLCLLRSSPSAPIYRSYSLRHIDKMRPVVSAESD